VAHVPGQLDGLQSPDEVDSNAARTNEQGDQHHGDEDELNGGTTGRRFSPGRCFSSNLDIAHMDIAMEPNQRRADWY